jgi:hypothetical protein
MNKTDEILKDIKEITGLEIINKSNQGIPLFDVPFRQPFSFDVQISYNSIKGMSSFELHFPSLYVKSNNVTDFAKTITYVVDIINSLNEAIKEDYSSEWVKQ